jgi:hypothetical protein
MENINATNITARINVIEPVPNVDINYGPYDNTEIAQQTLDQYGVWDENAIGLTVGVWKNSTHKQVTEYQLIKNNSGNLELTVKQAEVTPGITDYSALTGKPSINNHELSSGNNTLASIGAASASALSSHTSDSKIHVPMTYGGTTTAITGFKIEGEKMTITVGSSEYSFRLTEWHDIADFYVLFGQMTYSSGSWKIKIGNEVKEFNTVTSDEIITLKDNDFGYVVSSNKQGLNVTGVGVVQCDYIKEELPEGTNTLLILYRTTGGNIPTLRSVVSTNQYSGEYQYNSSTGVDNFNPNLVGNYTINNIGYQIKVYPNAATGDTWGITF